VGQAGVNRHCDANNLQLYLIVIVIADVPVRQLRVVILFCFLLLRLACSPRVCLCGWGPVLYVQHFVFA